MKKLLAVLLLALAVPSKAAYQGVLDLANMNPQVIAVRDLENGVWRAGMQYQIWHLQNTTSGNEVFHVSGFWAARLQDQEPAYGPSVGINLGQAVLSAINKLELLAPAVSQVANVPLPSVVGQVANLISFDAYGGYAPTAGDYGDHKFMYGFGGKLTIPLSTLFSCSNNGGTCF